jgi:surface glycoprotein (TIGR04207 family)
MTQHTDYSGKTRAAVLAAIMVLSVVGGTIAFAGSAAATAGDASATDIAVSDTTIAPNEKQIVQEIDVSDGGSGGSVTIDNIAINNSLGTASVDDQITNLSVYKDLDDDGEVDLGELVAARDNPDLSGGISFDNGGSNITALQTDTGVADGATETFLITVQLADTPNPFDDGETIQLQTDFGVGTDTGAGDSTFTGTNNNGGEAVATNAITTSAPTFANPSPTGIVSDDATAFTLDINDDIYSISSSTITVDITRANANDQTLTESGSDGVDFSSGTLTVDPAGSDVNNFGEGSNTVNVTVDNTNSETNYSVNSFQVDTTGPTITHKQPKDGEGLSSSSTIKVDITDSPAGVDQGTINAQINGEDVVNSTNNIGDGTTEDGVEYFAGGNKTLVIKPGVNKVPSLSSGSNSLTVSADDTEGNSKSSSISFDLDNTPPNVTDVTLSSGNTINRNDYLNGVSGNGKLEVTITFSEAMDVSEAPTVSIDKGGQLGNTNTTDVNNVVFPKEGVANNGFGNDTGFDGASKTFTGIFDANQILTDNTNETQEFVIATAQDEAGNNLKNDFQLSTYQLDTQRPSVSTSVQTSLKSGTVDVTADFSSSPNEATDDIAQQRYYYKSATAPDSAYTQINSPSSFDTTTIADGNVTFKTNATDTAGNPDDGAATFTGRVDNTAPSVSSTTTNGSLTSGLLNVTDIVSFSNLDNADRVAFKIDTNNDGAYENTTIAQSDPDNGPESSLNVTFGDLREFNTSNLNDETRIVVNVSVLNSLAPGANRHPTDTAGVELVVDNADNLQRNIAEQSDGTVDITLEPEPGAQMQSTTVYVNETWASAYGENGQKEYPGQSQSIDRVTLDESDFTESQDAFGNYTYTATVDNSLVPDGNYYINVASFTDDSGRSPTNLPINETRIVDQTRPGIQDAWVNDADGDEMNVTVEFNESVANDTDTNIVQEDFNVPAASGVESVNGDTNSSVLYLELNGNFQTGDAPYVEIAPGQKIPQAYNSSAGGNDIATHATSQKPNISSLQVNLSKGLNTFSVPAESGSISATQFKSVSGFQSIWYYNSSSSSWVNWNPSIDADADAPSIEGGEGFLVEMDQQSTAQFTVNTQVGLDDPFPTARSLSTGWNLLGQFQEGSQDEDDAGAGDAFRSIQGNFDKSAVYAQNGADPTSYKILNIGGDTAAIDPGEAYWVFMTSQDTYKPEPMDNGEF